MSIPWTEKYRPRYVREVVGNKQAVNQFLEWMRGWERGTPSSKAVMLVGPPGVGKTSLVLAYANEYRWDLVEVNASDERSGERLKALVGASASQTTIAGTRKRIILVDEVDGIAGKESAGGVAVLSSLIRMSRVPIVLVANDPWDPRLAPLRELAPMIKFSKVRKDEVLRHLKVIAEKEGLEVDEEMLKEISERAEGDMRAAINDLQLLSSMRANPSLLFSYLGERNREKNAFDVLAAVFGAKKASEGRQLTMNTELDLDQIFTWVYDNVFKQYQKPEALAEALKILADADHHHARLKRYQMWGLTRYITPLVGAGPGIVKTASGERGAGFEFPSKIRFMQQTRELRSRIEEATAKIAAKSKMSRVKAAIEMLPYITEMLRRGEQGISAHYGLNPDEVQAIKTIFVGRTTAGGLEKERGAPPKHEPATPRPRTTRARRRSP